MTGATVNPFIVQTALREAERIIERERIIRLIARDGKAFATALDASPPPDGRSGCSCPCGTSPRDCRACSGENAGIFRRGRRASRESTSMSPSAWAAPVALACRTAGSESARIPVKTSFRREACLAALCAGGYVLDSRVRGNDGFLSFSAVNSVVKWGFALRRARRAMAD
ncbi:MAG: DUF1778 domain-containing protein [Candidatus Accumulibacter sp.]|nr:DUF1778 domain-containing protein [Accumulibacter sp.]